MERPIPKALHDTLKRAAAEKGVTGKGADASVSGTLPKVKSDTHVYNWRSRNNLKRGK